MKRTWGIWVHVGLLGAAMSLAWHMSGRADEPAGAATASVDLWKVDTDQLHSISFDSSDRHVLVESKRDKVGRYAIVTIDTPAKAVGPDAGATPAASPQKKRMISVDGAEKLFDGMTRFRTLRTIGKLETKRNSEFGLDKPIGTIKVDLGGGTRVLTVGASTPGGGNYYVRDEQTGLVQVAVGEPISTLQYAEGRMSERDLHGFKFDDAVRIAVQAGGKRRQLVRVTGKSNAWADPAKPSEQDETASNWVTKLAQLRVTAYEEKYQNTPTPILRVEYGDAKTNLGFIELFRVADGADPAKYIVKTERSRWFAEVVKSQAEQIDRDVALIAK
jgi:hypothetical protein